MHDSCVPSCVSCVCVVLYARVHFVLNRTHAHTLAQAVAFAASDVAKHAFDNLPAFILNHIRDTCRTCVDVCAIYGFCTCTVSHLCISTTCTIIVCHSARDEFINYELRCWRDLYCPHTAFFPPILVNGNIWYASASCTPSVKSHTPEHPEWRARAASNAHTRCSARIVQLISTTGAPHTSETAHVMPIQ